MFILLPLLLPLLIYLIYRLTTPITPPNFPPGPANYPLAGGAYIFSRLNSNFTRALIELGHKYGPITGIHLGQMRSIVVTGYDAVKEVLSRDEFQGRPEIFLNKLTYGEGRKLGLIFGEGESWKNQRRFTLRHLRGFGFGKSSMETVIHEEISELIMRLKSGPNPVRLDNAFGPPVINVLWVILSGKRSPHDDPDFLRLLHLLYEVFRSGNADGGALQDWPFLRFFPPWSKQFKKMKDGRDALMGMLAGEVRAHSTALNDNEDDQPRDFIDLYLKEINAIKLAGNLDSDFTEEQLLVILHDLFAAGAESTTNTIAFSLLYMIIYPEVQCKVQAELDKVVGKARLPVYEDRIHLPYCEAVLCELMRISSIAPITVPHSTLQDVEIRGWTVPKDTFCLISLASVHMDKDYWRDPEVFRPERFLGDDGKVIKTERLMGFGHGWKYAHSFCTGLELDSGREKPDLTPVEGFTVAPKEFWARVTGR
ncbi:methyl farnesoate epoxidase isoform X2 [Folsomia candida]|uniref:methyl farnesoate epoxidase isoform X2 n=1 Tax=Folsomia candida TaxID=158441 RepID=UPI000B90104D|nr:methyl farnesoate epoxidase isoform X2 [Folsomia candida]